MRQMQRSLPLRYGAAVALGIVALLLSLLTGPLPGSSPFLLFGASVVLSAWFGGLGPGLLAAVLGGLGSAYLSLPPPRAPLTVSPADAVRLLILLLIAVVVSWAAGEVRRAQDTLRVQARQQAAVAQLGQRALENAPLGVLMDEAVALVAHTLAVEYCKILELLPGGREFLLRAGTGWEPGLVGTMRVPAESGLQSGYSLRAEQPVIIRDLRTETRFKGSALLEGHHVVSGMTVIIRGEGGPFGVLGAHSVAPRVFTQDDVNFLQAMANVLATAIRRAAAEETLRAQRESLQVTLDSIGDAVIAIDASNNVTFVNPVAARLTGWSQEEAAGKPLAQVFPIVNEETRQPVENPAERVIREGKVSGLANHTLLLARNGAEIPIGDTAAPIHDERGNLVGVVLVFRDITERRRAEKELRESRDQLEIILKDAADAITVQAPDGHLLFANDAAAQTIGFASAQELVNTPVLQTAQRFEIMDEEGRPLPLDQLPGRLALQGGQPPERVIRSRVLASGEERVSVVKATPVFDARGQVQFAINIFHDITERRRGEEVVRQQREWLRVTLASIGDAVIATDTQGRVTFMNPIAEALTGWPEGEAAGLNLSAVFRIFNEETRQEAENPVARVLREGAVVGLANHTILIARDGEEKQIDDSAAPIRDDRGQVIGVVMVFRDIRERRARERRRTAQYAVTRVLAEAQTLDEASRGLLSALGASLGWEYGALWNVDPEAHALHCVETWHTPAAEFPEFEAATRGRTFASGIGMPGRIWNQAEPAWLGEPAEDDNFPRAEAARADGLRSGFGLPILLGGRVLGVIEFYSRAPRAPDPDLLNELSGLGSQFGQFVERQRAEQAVRESEARQSAILESAMDAVITMNHLGSIVEINPAAEKIFRYRRDEMLGKQLADLLIPSSRRQEHGLGLQHYLATGEGQFLDRRVELTARRADGGEFPIELAVTRIRWNGPALFTAYVRDVTEQKRAEAALSHLAAIVESADAAIISKSLENRILSWNPAAERLYGYAAAEVIGQPVSILYPPDRQEELARLTAQVERGEPVENYETVRVHKDGRRIEVAVSLSALKDREGRLIGASGIERDITERKHVAERIRFQSNILENVRDSVVVMDRQDTIVYWNEGAAAVFGYSADEMVGRSPERLHPVSEPERFLAALKDLMTRGDYAGEWHAPRKGGARVWVDIKVSPMADAEGNALGYVSVAKDIADRKRAEEEQSLLAQASDLLAGSLDYSTTLVRVAQLAVPKVADWCSVDIVEPDGTYKTLALAHADPAKAAWGRELQRRYPPDPNAATGVAEVMRTGKSQLVPDISDELLARSTQDPELLKILQELGLKSVMTVPLIARGRALGAITFVAAESNHHFGPANLAFAEELARRAAIAVDNARLYQNEQQARRSAEHAADRTARLQTVTATLAEALEPEQVVDLVIRQGLAAMNARSGLVALVNPEHTMIQVVNQVGYRPEVMASWSRLPLSGDYPLSEAARECEPILLESFEEMAARYPDLREHWRTDERAFAAIPLVVEGRALGAMTLGFAAPRPFSAEDREFMLALARQCAQAIERARLYEAERGARAQAEAARERLAFLAEASGVLAASLDYEVTLNRLAQLCVPALADWCLVDMLEPDNSIRQVAVAHAEAGKSELARELRRRYPPEPDGEHVIARVLRSGESELKQAIADEELAARARDAEHLAMLRELGIVSHMVVPLIARGRKLGAISFVSGHAERRYGPEDLALAEELARRAALAVDNARLYREAQAAIQARDQFLSIASHELKTPLTSLLGFSELLQRRVERDGDISERNQRALNVIAEQAGRLNKLVGALLDISRLESGQLSIERAPVELGGLVRRLAEQAQLRLERHRLKVERPAAPVVVEGDELRLEQVVENLIQNAIKYSPMGGLVQVELRRGGQEAQLAVTDHGIGIPAGDIPLLFQRFYRAPNVNARHIGGMGVGLYVVKEIVELHGGRVEVVSREGEGSTFIVRVPLASPSGEAPEEFGGQISESDSGRAAR